MFGVQRHNVPFAHRLSPDLIPEEVCRSMPKPKFDAYLKKALDFANRHPVKRIFYIVRDGKRFFTCVILNRCVKLEDLMPKRRKSWKYLLFVLVKAAIEAGELKHLDGIVRISKFIDRFPIN